MKTRKKRSKKNNTKNKKQRRRRGGSNMLSVIPHVYNTLYNIYHGMEPPVSIQPWIY
jgi:hypothetical protein